MPPASPGISRQPDWKPAALLALLVAAGFLLFPSYIVVSLLALTLAILCTPLYRLGFRWISRLPGLGRRPRLARLISAAGAQALAFTVLAFCLIAPVWIFYDNRQLLEREGRRAFDQGLEWGRTQAGRLGRRFRIQELQNLAVEHPDPGTEAPPAAESQDLASRAAPLIPFAWKTLGQSFTFFAQLTVLVLVTHFFMVSGPGLWRHLLVRLPPGWHATAEILGGRVRQVVLATYLCQGLTAVAAFLIALPVFKLIVGPYASVMAMVAGLFQLIPLLGSSVQVLIMTIYFMATGDDRAAVLCMVLGFPLVVAVPDLVVRPWLARKTGQVSSITLLVGFVAGLEVFGAIGFILGPLLLDLLVQGSKLILYPSDVEKRLFHIESRKKTL